MRITKEEYEYFQKLKKLDIRNSMKSIENLEDDIDEPIKNCVAMLALLGCKPMYSCCGFDYDGQPIHKSHQYGEAYIKLTPNQSSLQIVYIVSMKWIGWFCKTSQQCIDLILKIDGNPHWRKEDCVHFSEELVIGIGRLERMLWAINAEMKDFVEICDTNSVAKKQLKNWQYEPKKSWVVYKKDFEKLYSV